MSSAKAVSFLAKKSWHTATMRHMEKVWKAEERAKAETKKLNELKQELAEEREMEQLRISNEAVTGIKKKSRVDFIYSEPLLNEPSTDDYLLGAKYSEKGEDNDVKNIRDKPGALWLDQPALNSESIQDKRTKVREDPLFTIRKEEQNQKTVLKNNPIKMRKLRDQILEQRLREELKEKKRKRKSEKSDKKSKKPKIESNQTDNKINANTVDTEHERYGTPREHHHGIERRRTREPDSGGRDSERSDRDYKSRDGSSGERDKEPGKRSSKKKRLTEEEKLRKLDEMRKDAEEVEKQRLVRVAAYTLEDNAERVKIKEYTAKDTPEFISTMGKDVFSGGSTASLEDRVKRNRYYIQKTNLDDRGIFK